MAESFTRLLRIFRGFQRFPAGIVYGNRIAFVSEI